MKYLLLIILFVILSINAFSKKVITLGNAATGISLQFLGEGELVGCDSWSKVSDGALGAVDLGPLQDIKFDLIKELKPDLIIVDPEFALFGNKEKINALGIKTHYISNNYSKNQTLKDIEIIADLLGKKNAYSDVKSDFKTLYASYELVKKMNKVNSKIIYLESNYKGGLMIAGKNTCPHYLLKEVGNKLDIQYTNWVTISKEEIEKLNADVIFISNKAVESIGGTDVAIKFFANTKAGKDDKIVIIDDWKMRDHGLSVSNTLLEIIGVFNNNGF